MTDISQLTDQQRATYRRASEYINDATCRLQETGLSYADTLITVLYEAACLVDYLHERARSELRNGHVDRGQRWAHVPCERDVIEADYGDAVGHRDAGIAQCT